MVDEYTLRSHLYSVLLICLVAGFPGCSKEGSFSTGYPTGDPCKNLMDTELAVIFGCPAAVTSKTCGISPDTSCSDLGAHGEWTGDTVKDGCAFAGLTMTAEGYVRDFLTDSCIPGSEVTIMDNESGKPLPLCSTSDATGWLKIEGVPFTTIGYRVRANPEDYKDTYKFNISTEETLTNQIVELESCSGSYAATGLTFQTVNAPTSEVIALSIPIELDKSKAVVAGTIKGGSWAGEGIEGFTATTDPPAESVNYMGTDGKPKCNPDIQGVCERRGDVPADCLPEPINGCDKTSLGDPVRKNKGAGVFVAFNVVVGQKVTMKAWLSGGITLSATTDVFPYPDSVCISNMVVP